MTVLRCVADFIGCRPTLPPVTSMDIGWSPVDKAWSVTIHLFGGIVRDLERWASAMDDVVTTRFEGRSEYTGEYTRIEVAGTVHGHSVTVWTTLEERTR
ncbi:hypothetical protein ACWGR4_27110 [Embleya sp. NPDC055664]